MDHVPTGTKEPFCAALAADARRGAVTQPLQGLRDGVYLVPSLGETKLPRDTAPGSERGCTLALGSADLWTLARRGTVYNLYFNKSECLGETNTFLNCHKKEQKYRSGFSQLGSLTEVKMLPCAKPLYSNVSGRLKEHTCLPL